MSTERLRDPSLLILCYHAIAESWPNPGAIRPATLGRQLRRALALGYRPRTLSDALREPHGARTVVVSFDDAFRSVLARGYPLLEDLGVPGTLFVPTDYAAEGAPMTWSTLGRWMGTEHEAELRCMTWDEVRRLAESGWEIGSHSCSHPNLTAIGSKDASRELVASREQCEARLQRPCSTIAYPFGAYDDRVLALARQGGYEHGVGLGQRLLGSLRPNNGLELPRDGVYRSTAEWQFRLLASPSLRRGRSVLPGSTRGERRAHRPQSMQQT